MSTTQSNGSGEPSSSGKRTTRATRNSAASTNETPDESIEPPTKKRRSSNAIPEQQPEPVQPAIYPETPEEIIEEIPEEQDAPTPESSNDVPGITVSGPEAEASSGETKSDEDNFASQTPVAWDDLQVTEQTNGAEAGTSAPTTRGRGRGGMRGSRRGKRGGYKSKPKPKPVSKPVAAASRARRRGGRRKASVNPRIDALNARAAELKAQYSTIAKLQKQALIALSEKSLEMLKEDPKYHESVPEYDQVTEGLQKEYMKTMNHLDLREEMEVRLAQGNYHIQKQLAESQLLVSRSLCLFMAELT